LEHQINQAYLLSQGPVLVDHLEICIKEVLIKHKL